MTRLAGAAWLLSAVLAVVGSFVPYMALRATELSMEYTAWRTTYPDPIHGRAEIYWTGLLAGAALLVVAGVLTLRRARLTTARLIGTGGAGLVMGITLVFMLSVVRLLTVTAPELHIEAGMWLLLLAALLPVAGIALTREPRSPDDIPTPPMGIPVVRVLDPDFEEPG